MFLKKTHHKITTYYYLMRKLPGVDRHEMLASLGSLEHASPLQEEELIRSWFIALLSGAERAHQGIMETKKRIAKSKNRERGRTFDLEQCIQELRAVHKKHGRISKLLLEKKARPNSEISWGVSTILNQLKNRGMTLSQAFEMAKLAKGNSGPAGPPPKTI